MFAFVFLGRVAVHLWLCFHDSLQGGTREKVNYKIQSNPDTTTPVLEGELFEFWLTGNWSGAFCKIGVLLRLRQGEGGTVLWEKRLRAEEDDMVIIPNAMQAAMTSLLQSAVTEFSSAAFAEAVAGRKQVY